MQHCPSDDWLEYNAMEEQANGYGITADIFADVGGIDAAKWDVTDWYPANNAALRDAIVNVEEWDTGWYSCKKEIQSGRVYCNGNEITCEVSVSDDFDTEGRGCSSFLIPKDWDGQDADWIMELIESHLYAALEQAKQDQRDNALYAGYSIGRTDNQGQPKNWLETYVAPLGFGDELDEPPGDYYYHWGWQAETDEIPAHIKEQFEEFASNCSDGMLVSEGWYIKSWNGEN